MVTLGLVEVLDGVAQRGARHSGGEPVEEIQESFGCSLANLAHPPTNGLVDRVVGRH